MHTLLKVKDLGIASFLFLWFASGTARAQNELNAWLVNHSYTDKKMSIEIPASWHVAIDHEREIPSLTRGAILRKGKYILRLCTGCRQASGVTGGRFSEIATMVQPWYRDIEPAPPCGEPAISRISSRLDRVDFWYRRDFSQPQNKEGDCHEPATLNTVWYGSYFTQHCTAREKPEECGGYFLNHNQLTGRPQIDLDEMAFTLTYDTLNPNQLPEKDSRALREILREATAIVKSVHFRVQP